MSDGTQQSITGPVAWQASPPAVATITVQGTVTGVGKGVAQVSASYQTFAAGITVTVGPPALVSIAVSPNPFSLPLGESQQFTATGTYPVALQVTGPDGTAVATQTLTIPGGWAPPRVAVVEADHALGLAAAFVASISTS